MLGTPPAFVLSQDQTLVLNPVLNLEVFPSSSKLILELTVSINMTRENHVRVLLDSVSFSRIMSSAQGSFVKRLARGDLMYYT